MTLQPQQKEFEVKYPKDFLMKSGIYMIMNLVTNKFYIGSAQDLKRRKAKHFRYLSKNIHPTHYLQNAYNKYGKENFTFIILEFCNIEGLLEREQSWITATKCWQREIGYNICQIATNRTGVLHSEETKKKMSEDRKGRIVSEETRIKIGLAHKGKFVSEESRKKISDGNKGKIVTAETRANMANGQTGRKHSEESKLKRSVILKGKPFNNPKKDPRHSEETKKKQSEARKKYLEEKNKDFWGNFQTPTIIK